MRARKTFSNWLTNKNLLIIRNEENFAEKTTFSFTYAKLIALLFGFFLVLMVICLYLAQSILGQWFNPRYEQIETNKKLVDMSRSIDSLAVELHYKNTFIEKFQAIVDGKIGSDEPAITAERDSALRIEPDATEGGTRYDTIDAAFRREFESQNLDARGLGVSYGGSELVEQYFFTPLTGIVSAGYSPSKTHYGVDIVAKSNEPIKCVADGTVIFTDYDFSDSGYVIAVQHRNNMISIYKHNSAILKKVGNFVSGGEIIAIIGNTGELTTGPHLHFELWFNGNPVNPEDFISF